MNAAAAALPPYRTLAAALRKTTEHLAREVAQPSESPPSWNDVEWGVARSVAAMQGISVLLANRLRWRGPPEWQSFLATQQQQSVLREARIGNLLERIDHAAREAQLGFVALKGSALRRVALYAPGERPMGDIDLLVREDDRARVAVLMGALDYALITDGGRHDTYCSRSEAEPCDAGEHADNPIPVEVHVAVAERLPFTKVDITANLQTPHTNAGTHAYPSLAALMLHLLLHAAGNMMAHALRQIQLHDLYLLAPRLRDDDWERLIAIAETGDGLWWAFPPLTLALRYYDCRIPQELLLTARRSCPRVLRTVTERKDLTEVSWSNLRISALPGIAWSRSPMEFLRYMRSRALPSRAALAALRPMVERYPHMQNVPWYQLSQSHRIVRWLFSRPPRVQTITSVRAALLRRNA